MYSELIVHLKPEAEEVNETERLTTGEGHELFQLLPVVSIRRDNKGQGIYRLMEQKGDSQTSAPGQTVYRFARAIFGREQDRIQRRLCAAGLDPYFLQAVNNALQPGRHAHLIYVPHNSLIDSQQLILILGRQPGELFHTTFRPQVEEALSTDTAT